MNHTYTSNVNLVDRTILQGSFGAQRRMQPNRRVSMVLCSVKSGAVDIYFGSFADTGQVPDLHFGQVNKPEWVPIPCGQYEFVLVASDPLNTTEASVILGGPGE